MESRVGVRECCLCSDRSPEQVSVAPKDHRAPLRVSSVPDKGGEYEVQRRVKRMRLRCGCCGRAAGRAFTSWPVLAAPCRLAAAAESSSTAAPCPPRREAMTAQRGGVQTASSWPYSSESRYDRVSQTKTVFVCQIGLAPLLLCASRAPAAPTDRLATRLLHCSPDPPCVTPRVEPR